MAETKRPAGNRWSAERRTLFLETLALTSNVAAAERAAEVGPGSAYKQRARDPEFHEAWEQALREGYDRLELKTLERAIKGQRKNRRGKDGKIVGYDVEFSERLALTLLNGHRQSVRGGGAADGRKGESAESFRKRLAAKIDALRKAHPDV